jgi:hypothetical protein
MEYTVPKEKLAYGSRNVKSEQEVFLEGRSISGSDVVHHLLQLSGQKGTPNFGAQIPRDLLILI